jgi:hypothetical protein
VNNFSAAEVGKMDMPCDYIGRIFRIDFSEEKIWTEDTFYV